MAGTLAGMQIERAGVVHGAAGWDEATPIGPFLAFDVTPGAVRRRDIDPREFGISRCASGDLAGGDRRLCLLPGGEEAPPNQLRIEPTAGAAAGSAAGVSARAVMASGGRPVSSARL